MSSDPKSCPPYLLGGTEREVPSPPHPPHPHLLGCPPALALQAWPAHSLRRGPPLARLLHRARSLGQRLGVVQASSGAGTADGKAQVSPTWVISPRGKWASPVPSQCLQPSAPIPGCDQPPPQQWPLPQTHFTSHWDKRRPAPWLGLRPNLVQTEQGLWAWV